MKSKIIIMKLIILISILFLQCNKENQKKFDFIIKNGMIVDGTGNTQYRADVGIIGEKIIKIGSITETNAFKIIDASQKIVAPGFIDIHTHADGRILEDRTAHNLVTQGITTAVGGNCGGSKTDLKKFFKEIEEGGGIAINLAMLIGHNSVRARVMGNAGRDPTPEEMEQMKKIVEEAMKDGAVGISTGLKYQPGCYSKTEEVVELAKIASKYGGFYATHLRDEGLKLFESMNEAFDIAEKAGIPLQLSHHKVVGTDMWGKTEISLKMMEDAQKRGIKVTTDLHPYPATYTGLSIIFPEWAIEGKKEDIRKRFNDPETRKKIKEGIIYNIIHDRGGNDISNIVIGTYQPEPDIQGKNLKEILIMKGIKPTMENAAELCIELFEKGEPSAIFHCLKEEDIVRIMKHPLAMIASDAEICEYNKGFPHPRHYGNFPRILGIHVRERGDFSIEEAIKKMTSMVASKVGISDRGIISENKCADIVIFDPKIIQDKATWQNPHQYPVGIDYVIVNGDIVVENGKITGKLPGKIIYGAGKKPITNF